MLHDPLIQSASELRISAARYADKAREHAEAMADLHATWHRAAAAMKRMHPLQKKRI